MTFKVLHQVLSFVWKAFPLVRTKIDLDILATVGAAEEEGCPLNMKQLGLLRIGAAATVRRRLVWLIKCGYVRKVSVEDDARVTVLRVNPRLKKQTAVLEAMLGRDSRPQQRGRRDAA